MLTAQSTTPSVSILADQLPRDKLRWLGFLEHPFLSSADPRFLFLSSQHLSVLDRLEDHITHREGLAVVEGALGTGKTSVARRLLDRFRDRAEFCVRFIHTADYTTSLVALQDISRHFAVRRRRANVDQVRELEITLADLDARGQDPVVIIDDAQRMATQSLDAMQSLLNFDKKAKLLQIILFAQPEFHDKIGRVPSVFERVSSWQILSNLPADDALAMINYRCQTAGRDEPLLNDDSFMKIYHFTHGVPRQIVSICNEVLYLLARDAEQAASAATVDEAIQRYRQREGAGRLRKPS